MFIGSSPMLTYFCIRNVLKDAGDQLMLPSSETHLRNVITHQFVTTSSSYPVGKVLFRSSTVYLPVMQLLPTDAFSQCVPKLDLARCNDFH